MSEGFKKLVAVCRDASYKWWSFSGRTATQTLSRKISDEHGGFAASPLDVAAGVTGEGFVSGDWSTRCATLGLTKPEQWAAFDAFFSGSIIEGFGELSMGWREMSLEEYKEFLQLHAKLTGALGTFSERDYRDALSSIGLGKKTVRA